MLTASYASTVTVTTTSQQEVANFAGGSNSVLSACWLPNGRIACGGMDRTARVYEVPLNSDEPDSTPSAPKLIYQLPLHDGPVGSVRASGNAVLTAGWDGLIGYWRLNDSQAAEQQEDVDADRARTKRRKTTSEGLKLTPVHVLQGHTRNVSKAIFDRMDSKTAYSAGLDASVRAWDLETGAQKNVRNSDKTLLALDQFASANLLVTGSTDRAVSIWDLRQCA